MKAFKIYLTVLGVVVYLLVNIPLFITIYNFSDDPSLAWKIIRNSPHQFLFLFVLFPVGLICLIRTGHLIKELALVKKQEINFFLLKNFNSAFIAINFIFLLIAILFSTASRTHTTSDVYKLKPEYARYAVQAKEILFHNILESKRFRSSWDSLLIQTPGLEEEWSSIKANYSGSNFKASQFLNDVVKIVYEKVREKNGESQYWNELLNHSDTSPPEPKNISEAILFLQFIYDANLLFELEENKNKHILNTAILKSSLTEFTGSIFVILHFFLFSVIVIFLRLNGTIKLEGRFRKLFPLLFTILSVFCMWFSLRIYSINEISLLFGGESNASLQLLSGFVFIAAMAIYLLYPTFSNNFFKLALELSPILLAIIPIMFTIFDPVLTSKILGSSANFTDLSMLILTYFIVISPWLYMNLVYKRQYSSNNVD